MDTPLTAPCIYCGNDRPLESELCPTCGRGWIDKRLPEPDAIAPTTDESPQEATLAAEAAPPDDEHAPQQLGFATEPPEEDSAAPSTEAPTGALRDGVRTDSSDTVAAWDDGVTALVIGASAATTETPAAEVTEPTEGWDPPATLDTSEGRAAEVEPEGIEGIPAPIEPALDLDEPPAPTEAAAVGTVEASDDAGAEASGELTDDPHTPEPVSPAPQLAASADIALDPASNDALGSQEHEEDDGVEPIPDDEWAPAEAAAVHPPTPAPPGTSTGVEGEHPWAFADRALDPSAPQHSPATDAGGEAPLPAPHSNTRSMRIQGLVVLGAVAAVIVAWLVVLGIISRGGSDDVVTQSPETSVTAPVTDPPDDGAATTTTAAATTTTTAPTTTVTQLTAVGDPLEISQLALGGFALGPFDFGSTEALGRLVATFGQPDAVVVTTTEWGTCADDEGFVASWGPLDVMFTGTTDVAALVGYRVATNGDHPAARLSTLSGLSAGASVAEMEQIYDGFNLSYESVDGTDSFILTRTSDGVTLLWGPVSASDPDGVVEGIYSPRPCDQGPAPTS